MRLAKQSQHRTCDRVARLLKGIAQLLIVDAVNRREMKLGGARFAELRRNLQRVINVALNGLAQILRCLKRAAQVTRRASCQARARCRCCQSQAAPMATALR